MKKINLRILVCLFVSFGILITCKKLEQSMLVSTGEISNIQINSVEAEGTIIDLGEGITQHGHYYSKSSDPAKDILHTSLGSPEGTGGFISQISGLEAGTKYYITAYATNGTEFNYGEIKSFTTLPAVVPVLTTNDVTAITTTGGTGGGNITSEGGAAVTARGVCWNTTGTPSVSDNKTTDGSGGGIFTSNITGLSPGTTYHVRSYATNSAGTGYGDEKTFSTTAATTPVVVTTVVSDITQTSASSGGNITSDGGLPVTARGVCWNKTGSPTIADNKTTDGDGAGLFGSNITGLSSGTIYYLKAYAVNNAGTSYGQEVSFSTSQSSCEKPVVTSDNATQILPRSATLNGTVNAKGFESSVFFEYGLTAEYGNTINSSPAVISTNVITQVNAVISTLLPNTLYHFRLKAVNCSGTEYSNDQTFTSSCESALSTTGEATSVSNISATLNGSVNPNNSSTTVTFDYGLTASYGNTINPAQSPVTGSDVVAVSAQLSGLVPNTVYHYSIRSNNCAGTISGADKTFTTLCNAPVCNISPASSITSNSADLNGSVNANGFSTDISFEYGLSANPYSSSVTSVPGTTTGNSNTSVSASLTGLSAGKTYHYRVKAVSCGGTIYSADAEFTTPCPAPTCSTADASSIENTSVTLNGTANPGLCSTTVVFEYGPTTSYGSTIDASESPLITTGSASAIVSGLISGKTYHYRIKSTNPGGTSYGNDIAFTTTIKDIDANVYTKVLIGTQVWMLENLKTAHYRNGESISNVTDNTAWSNLTSGAYCIYNNTTSTYGKLYNWYAANDSRGLCPAGWHVPTDAEWSVLDAYMIANGYNYDGSTTESNYAKALASTTGWTSSTVAGSVGRTDLPSLRNASGFTAYPGSSRDMYGSFGIDYPIGSKAAFWSSTESSVNSAWQRYLLYCGWNVVRSELGGKKAGLSVRCLRGD